MENMNQPKKYWKSLEQLKNQDAFNAQAEKEFMSSPLQSEDGKDGVARRDFLKLMGASIALSSTACVRRPVQKIVPYAKRPENMVMGVSNWYASSVLDNMAGYSVVVRTREGRPLKLEPNTLDAMNGNGLSARAQAHVVSLYDQDRLEKPLARIPAEKDFHKRIWNEMSWEKVDDKLIEMIEKENVAILTGNIASPSKQAAISDFAKTFKVKHYSWQALENSAVAEAQKLSYGSSLYPRYRFDKARMVVSVGADFLGADNNEQEYSSAFAKARQPGENMAKLVSFEGLLSLTGANADTRVRVKPSQYLEVLLGLAHEIVVKNGQSTYASDSKVKSVLANYADMGKKLGMDAGLFEEIAKDLWEHRGSSIVTAGGTLSATTNNEVDVLVAANFLNSVLSNDGKTIDYSKAPLNGLTANKADMLQLLADLKAQKIDLLIIEGINPAYNLPASFGFADALKDAKFVVYMGQHHNETAELADMILPTDHALENWGDAEFRKGVFNIQQPTIRPLHDSRSLEMSMLNWAYMSNRGPARLKDSASWHDYVKRYWKENILRNSMSGEAFENFWHQLLQDGVYNTVGESKDQETSARRFNTASLSSLKSEENHSLALSLYAKSGIGDGDYANIAWMQEFPDPITKVTWDNYLTVSVAFAERNSLKEEDMVRLTVGSEVLELPVYVQPGQHDEVLGLAIGYGRTKGGQVCEGVGFNASNFITKDLVASNISAKVEKIGKKYELANTQGHNSMLGRQIIIEATLESYLKEPSAGIHKHKIFSIWNEHEYKGYKWAMSIDLNSCFGCGSCVIACQAENNIPVVGKKYVLEGREMHWMSIHRYYSGDEHNPDVSFQPMLCHHCDNAPCETVCPVVATTHSEEGLNDMTYNRCVGTRYCSNNCPYKVRRFNWFAYTKGDRSEDTPKEAYNPDVTVRSRGVMEKCTFCVQRIHEVKNIAKDEGRKVKDGEIKVACEQGCPSNAIVFGDMNDPNSRVSKHFADQRTYKLLEEYNTVPSVRYKTKIRNAKRENSNHHGEGHH